jgi:Domain of unknown function (DUF4360)
VWGRLSNSESHHQESSINMNETTILSMDFDHHQTTQEQQQQRSLITVADPTFFGSGCPSPGSGRVIIPAYTVGQTATMKVVFTNYEARTTNEVLRDYQSCNMALPVKIEQGVSIGIQQVDYYGYAIVPANSGSARFDAEYFFAGSEGPKTSKTYVESSPFNGKIHISDAIETTVWSPCGGETNFRINTSLLASKPSRGARNVLITMDRQQVDGFDFVFKTKRC